VAAEDALTVYSGAPLVDIRCRSPSRSTEAGKSFGTSWTHFIGGVALFVGVTHTLVCDAW